MAFVRGLAYSRIAYASYQVLLCTTYTVRMFMTPCVS